MHISNIMVNCGKCALGADAYGVETTREDRVLNNLTGGSKQGPRKSALLIIALLVVVLLGVIIFTHTFAKRNQSVDTPSRQVEQDTSQNNRAATSKTPTRTVRIAVTRDGFWFPDRTSNVTDGYGGAYMKALEAKTGWRFQAKVYPFNDRVAALQKGEVDIIGPLVYSKERADELMFMDVPSGRSATTFYTLPDSLIAYRDYKSFNNKRIGVIKNSSSEGVIKKDAILNNYSYTPVYFEDNRALIEGLLEKKCDIFVAQSMCVSNKENFKIVDELQETNFFFATSGKDIALSRKLNAAINSLLLADPNFNETLTRRYLEPSDNTSPRFTQDEMAYLSSAKTLRVAYVKHLPPVQYVAGKNSTSLCGIDGIVGRVLDSITQKTGLTFVGVGYNSMEDAEDGVKDGKADIISTYLPQEENFVTDNRIVSSASYLSLPVVGIAKKGHELPERANIGVPYQLRWTIPVLRKEKPQYSYELFPSRTETVKALQSGDIDCLLAGSLMAESILNSTSNGNLKVSDYTNLVDRLCFGISDTQDDNLIRIINKSIASFDLSERNLLLADPKQSEERNNLWQFALDNWTLLLLIAGVFVCAGIIILLTVRHENKKTVNYIAYIDPITGLPNRSKFIQVVEKLIEKDPQNAGAIAILDIDSFKSINDMYGMGFGDELLNFIGERISNASPHNTYVARDSSDMFLIYIDPSTPEVLQETLEKIINSVSRISFKHAGMLDLSVSAGVYKLEGNESPNKAINCADIARVNIKDDHGRHIEYFTAEMRKELTNQTILENDLKLALERNEFELYYQPKINVTNCTVAGFEALIRWNHPLAGVLGPSMFIPLAEKIGLIEQITEWVINESCANIARLGTFTQVATCGDVATTSGMTSSFQTSINFSSKDLSNPHIIEILKKATRENNVDPCTLEIEITESALLSDTQTALSTLNEIRELGFSIALDDFGTGYSSLSSLKDLPLNTVKLDRSFIRDIEVDERSQNVLKTIINLAKVLDLETVAEGVENDFQAQFLRNIGCQVIQGFYFAPGMPLDEAYHYLLDSLDKHIEPGYKRIS